MNEKKNKRHIENTKEKADILKMNNEEKAET